jgi:hypothetical protein
VTVTLVSDGILVPAQFVLESENPFPAMTGVDQWTASSVAEFDGRKTVKEVYRSLQDAVGLPESLELADFIDLVALMIERGYLEVDDSLFAG